MGTDWNAFYNLKWVKNDELTFLYDHKFTKFNSKLGAIFQFKYNLWEAWNN